MKKYNLCDIADGKIPIPSEKCDVHCGEHDRKMMRRVVRVEWVTEKTGSGGNGHRWLHLWWEKETGIIAGDDNWGHSAYREDAAGLAKLCLIGDSHE